MKSTDFMRKLLSFVLCILMLFPTILPVSAQEQLASGSMNTIYHEGDFVTASVYFNNIQIDNEEAELAAFNYKVVYDYDNLEYVGTESFLTCGSNIINNNTQGVIEYGFIYDPDVYQSGGKVYNISFNVIKEVEKINIVGSCSNLSVVSPDKLKKAVLLTPESESDNYSSIEISISCEHTTDTDTSSENPIDTTSDTSTEEPVNTETDTSTEEPVNTATDTSTEEPVNTATDTSTEKPVNTATDTSTEKPVNTATDTSTEKPVNTATDTSTEKPVNTATDTSTEKPVNTATDTSTEKPVNTATDTSTEKPADTDIVDFNDTDSTIALRKFGDVNGDNKVTVADSIIVNRYVINLTDLNKTELYYADYDRNGRITSLDSLKIQRYALGLMGENDFINNEVTFDEQKSNSKQYHQGDTINVLFSIDESINVCGVYAAIYFDPNFVKFAQEESLSDDGVFLRNALDDRIVFGESFTDQNSISGDIYRISFIALKDFNISDTGIFKKTSELIVFDESKGDEFGNYYLVNKSFDDSQDDTYTKLDISVDEKNINADMGDKYVVTITVTSPDDEGSKTPKTSSSSAKQTVSGKTEVYHAVYDYKTGSFISDYIPKTGDDVLITVISKSTGNIVNQYHYTFDEEQIAEECNGITITIQEETVKDDIGKDISVLNLEVKADIVDLSLIEDNESTSTPDMPDLPDTQDTPDYPASPDLPDKPKTSGVYGDVDGDGRISAKDSLLIQRYVINLKKLDDNQFAAGDVNHDGKVTNKDALDILRFTIHLSKNKDIGQQIA